ncbi:hypothetical protein EDC01DRAFT_258428 [Geopyxis carbonaria]|nr:hypothetical protein EDC01DRAFT_258428 [Geopyxis carbonaria]
MRMSMLVSSTVRYSFHLCSIRCFSCRSHSCVITGTLMAPKVLSRVIYGTTDPAPFLTENLKIKPAVLYDHVRYHVKDVDYPAIVKRIGLEVKGVYVRGIRATEMARLDEFEGSEYIRCYRRVTVDPDDITNRSQRNAHVYIWNQDEAMLNWKEWEYEDFIKTKLRNWTGEPLVDPEPDPNADPEPDPNADPKAAAVKDPLGGRWCFVNGLPENPVYTNQPKDFDTQNRDQ